MPRITVDILHRLGRLTLLCAAVLWLQHGAVFAAEVQPAGSDKVFQNLSPAEAKKLVNDHRGEIVVVDVRTAGERTQAAIDGSIHIDMNDIFLGRHNLRKEQSVLLYCAVGGRSYAVAKWLQMKGYYVIYNLDGGIDAWQKRGFSVVKGE